MIHRCGDFESFMFLPDLHRLSCFLGHCLMEWALGDGFGWAFGVGLYSGLLSWGVEDLAII